MKIWHYTVAFVLLILIAALAISHQIIFNFKHTSQENSFDAYTQVVAEKSYPPVPVLVGYSVNPPVITAEASFVVDVDSGVSLFEKKPDEKLLPASTAKIITAMVAMDSFAIDDVVTVGKINVVGQKMGLIEGERITVADLISGLLIYSANDAAEALASHYPGGRDEFIRKMNEKGKELHLENSNYTNPAGLDVSDINTTARDLARESMVAMKIPFFREVVGTKEKTVTSLDGVYKHKLVNVNELVGEIPGVLGIKTGWTENAKENLVTYVDRDGRKVIFVVLKSDDRFGETINLIDWVFSNYEWKNVKI